jgi:hypothetical protein
VRERECVREGGRESEQEFMCETDRNTMSERETVRCKLQEAKTLPPIIYKNECNTPFLT